MDKVRVYIIKTISSSSFDVIVIRQPNGSYKSTPFQVAFSSNLLRNITKKNEVQLFVNEKRIEIPLRLDIQNGRITFIKVLYRDKSRNTRKETSFRTHRTFPTTTFPSDRSPGAKWSVRTSAWTRRSRKRRTTRTKRPQNLSGSSPGCSRKKLPTSPKRPHPPKLWNSRTPKYKQGSSRRPPLLRRSMNRFTKGRSRRRNPCSTFRCVKVHLKRRRSERIFWRSFTREESLTRSLLRTLQSTWRTPNW